MANFVYVDNSNVWIEGMRVSAVARGDAPDLQAAIEYRILDYSWKIDFGKLYQFACGDNVGRAVLYGSRPPANDSLWKIAEAKGFEVHVEDRSVANKEKKIDTGIVADIIEDSFTRMKAGDEITIVAGDSDYVPAVGKLRARKFQVDVAFWNHGSRELRDVCSKFISLNPYLDHLRKQ